MKRIILITFAIIIAISTAHISYAQDEEGQSRKMKRSRPAVKNIYGINLFHVTDENIGFSASCEHFIDRGMVSLYLPFAYSLAQMEEEPITYRSGNSYIISDTQTVNHYSKGMLYFYPGLKVYPWGANKKVSVAFGTSLVVAAGKVNNVTTKYSHDIEVSGGEYFFVNHPLKQISDEKAAFKTGVMLTSFFNMRPTKNWYFGMELGLGYCYTNLVDGKRAEPGNSTLAQFGFKIGYAK